MTVLGTYWIIWLSPVFFGLAHLHDLYRQRSLKETSPREYG
jgi:hypothetical protein